MVNRFTIYLAEESSSNHEGEGPQRLLQQAILGEVFLSDDDIVSFHWHEQMMELTPAATDIMFPNWAEFVKDDEGVAPTGKYPDSEGKTFILTLGDRRLNIGIVAGIQVLYSIGGQAYMMGAAELSQPTMIYPGQPLVQHGRMMLGIGNPKVEECGEDFLKIFVEDGPERCFGSALGDEIREHFAAIGKLSE